MSETPLLLRAIRGEPIPRPPVWIMRQAGRYLSEYRDLKAQHSFLEMCRTPELALEVSLQPIRYLNVDAAIIFSDIMIPATALGFEIDFAPGPVVKNPITSGDDIARLRKGSVRDVTSFVPEAIRRLADAVRPLGKAVLGFAGAPWTMCCYLIDQKPYKHFERTQILAAENPAAVHAFLARLRDITIDYLQSQIEAGADAVQLFDTWAVNVSAETYREFGLPYLRDIVSAIQSHGTPVIAYANGMSHLTREMVETGATVIGIDSRMPLAEADRIFSEQCIQGNLDATALFGEREHVIERTQAMLGQLKRRSRYIANLGHGILQTTPRENALAFVQTVQRGW